MIYHPKVNQEVFKLEVVYKAGKWFEPKFGVAHFTASMLDKGTRLKSSKQIAELLDYYGAQIEATSGYDFATVTLYGLKKYFKEIIAIFYEIVTEPSFQGEELQLQKDIFIQNLKINNEKNSFLASKLIRKNIFGYFHPYGHSTETEDVVKLTIDDLQSYFISSFTPHEIFLIGNLDDEHLKLISQCFKFSSHPNIEKENTQIVSGQTPQYIKRESIQSTLRLGKLTINRNHEDYFSVLLLNHILGGYFGSRLMKNIREKKGLTYGIYSSIVLFKNESILSIGADVGKEKSNLALSEIKHEMNFLADEPIPDEELHLAKNHLLGNLQLEAANPFASFEKVKNIRLNNLEVDYYTRLVIAINNIDSIKLKDAAIKYLNTENLFEVVVG
ncbi:MAG: insulinase family protein [Bacteroidetes bacterium]|nr:insulinase family protein [Bacteroidota bacterium]